MFTGLQCGRQLRARVALFALLTVPLLAAGSDKAPLTDDHYRKQGLKAALQAKQALGGQLMQAMQTGGPESAVAFCNTKAIPITDAVSSDVGMTVNRVSDRPRNADNAASATERKLIQGYKEMLLAGAKPVPEVQHRGKSVVAYYPIITNGMCLTCHGRPGADISESTQAVIDAHYPEDQATGYGVNELRGLFVVTMER